MYILLWNRSYVCSYLRDSWLQGYTQKIVLHSSHVDSACGEGNVKAVFPNILWGHLVWADPGDIVYPPPSLLLFVTTKIPLRLLILMGSQGNLIINACQTQKHWHCHVISVTILRAQSSRTPGDLIFITANEGDKMCSNSHFCNDWVYYRVGWKACINNQKETIGKRTNSCKHWFSLRVSVDVLIQTWGGPGWIRLWDCALWPCRTIFNGLVTCDGLDFSSCMKISLDERFIFPSLQT